MRQTRITTSVFLLSTVLIAGTSFADERSPAEKDREAILAMAGDYKVRFTFEETVALKPDYELKDRYEEDATETVKVVIDEPSRIVLQHLLMAGGEGVIKHWKQEWVYEDKEIYHFVGDNEWVVEELSPEQVTGTWSQRVSQVDDSPRYESYGAWVHHANFSEWTSKPTRRPLPRREHTKRKDYTVLQGVNRHTITPTGWIHEQDNYKQENESGAVLCREVGLNTYDRTTEVDCTQANKYWDATAPFWAIVSEKWDSAMAAENGLHLRSIAGGKPLFRHLFGLAKKADDQEFASPDQMKTAVDEVVDLFVIRSDSES